MTKVQAQCCFTSVETPRGLLVTGSPWTATSTFTQLLSSDLQQDKPSSSDSPTPSPSSDRPWASEKTWCLTSTETIRFVRDGEEGGGGDDDDDDEMMLNVLRCQLTY